VLEMQHHPGPAGRRTPVSPRAHVFHALRIGQVLPHVIGQVSYLPGEICHCRLDADPDDRCSTVPPFDASEVRVGIQSGSPLDCHSEKSGSNIMPPAAPRPW
jgi:hypothetical protein